MIVSQIEVNGPSLMATKHFPASDDGGSLICEGLTNDVKSISLFWSENAIYASF